MGPKAKKSRIKKIKNNLIFEELKGLDDNVPDEEDAHGEEIILDKKGRAINKDIDIDKIARDYDQFNQWLGSNKISSGVDQMESNLKRKRKEGKQSVDDDIMDDDFGLEDDDIDIAIGGQESKGGNKLHKNDRYKSNKKQKKRK